MISVRFDVINNMADKYEDTSAYSTNYLPAVPGVGETINIKGNPFIVHSRGWAVSDDDGDMYCYIRLIKCFEGPLE